MFMKRLSNQCKVGPTNESNMIYRENGKEELEEVEKEMKRNNNTNIRRDRKKKKTFAAHVFI